MADEESGSPTTSSPVGPLGGQPTGSAPKEPGWYPVRSNPNEQSYWDGTDWTRRRRWTVGAGWNEVGDTPDFVPVSEPEGLAPRFSANPYAPRSTPRTSAAATAGTAPGVTLANFLLLASGIAVMLASITTWVTSSFSSGVAVHGSTLSLSATSSGVDPVISSTIGINGFVTLAAGVVMIVFAGLLMVSDDAGIRVFAALFALATVGLGIYVVVRLLQKINDARVPHGTSVSLGWGAMLLLGAAVLGALVAISELRAR